MLGVVRARRGGRARGSIARHRRRRRGDRPGAGLARAGGDREARHLGQAVPDREHPGRSRRSSGAGLGILAARRFVFGAPGIAFMAAVGTAASFRDPQTEGPAPLWVGLAGAAAGIAHALASAAGGSGDLGARAVLPTGAQSTGDASSGSPAPRCSSPPRRARRPAARGQRAASTRSARRSAPATFRRAAPPPPGARLCDPRAQPAVRPERRLLPHRHRPGRAAGRSRTAGRSRSTAGSTTR